MTRTIVSRPVKSVTCYVRYISFSPGDEAGTYDKGIVKGSKDMSNTENELAGTDLGTESDVLLNLDFACFLAEKE